MDLPVKIISTLIFPVISTFLLIFLPVKKRAYFVSALLFMISIFLFIFSRIENITILGNDLFYFPLIFSVGDLYANLVRFAFALTGSLTLIFVASKKDLLLEISSLWAISSAILITLADNFLTLFLFWEMLTISTAAIIFLKKDKNSFKNAWFYLLTHLTGGLIFLVAILKNYKYTGSLLISTPETALYLFVLAIGIKTAFIPLYFWLPKGYPAADWQGSVVLSALSTKVGVYALARILPPSLAIAYMGGIMAVFGVLMALLQKKMRSLLSYHIISQVGYMVAGVGLGLTLSVDGGLLHLLNHMLYKALLFMSAGAVIFATNTEELKKLGGLTKKLPLTTISALIGSLAITGFPFFNGFISKTILKYGTNEERVLSLLLLLASIGTTISFAKFMYFGFLKNKKKDIVIKKVPWSLKIPMILTSLIIILFGVFPHFLARVAPYQSNTFVYSLSSIRSSLLIILSGVIFFILLKPFINPAMVNLPQRLLSNFDLQVNKSMDQLFLSIIKISKKEHLINMANSMWIFLFLMGFIISGFLFRILLF